MKPAAPPIPPKPYFPFCLLNGIDSLLLDYSGSMTCDSGHLHTEQLEGAVCSWQKIPHRRLGRQLVPLLQFPYRLLAGDGELYEVGAFAQRFEPRQATLITQVESDLVHLEVSARLERDRPVLVESYKVRWVRPGSGAKLGFFARQPPLTMPGLMLKLPASLQVNFHRPTSALIAGDYRFDEIAGSFAMAVRGRPARVVNDHMLEVRNLRPGQVIHRLIAVADAQPRAEAQNAVHLLQDLTPRTLRQWPRRQQRAWSPRADQPKLHLPDRELQQLYDLSHWLIRASQDPHTGFITTGPYSAFKGGGHANYWDWSFSVRALLTGGLQHCAKQVLDFYQATAPQARIYAQQLDKPGAFFPWFASIHGENLDFADARERPGIQKWNNCCVAQHLLGPWRTAGDTADLRRRLPLLREVLTFLLATIVTRRGRRWEVTPLQGADENIDRRNDTAHLVTLLDALRGAQAGCLALGEQPDPQWLPVITGLEAALRGNTNRAGVVLPHRGAKVFSSEAFSFESLLQPMTLGRRTLDAALARSHGAWGLTNGGTYRNLVWPWTEARAALAFSFHRPAVTYACLRRMTAITSTLGVMPEKVRPDGFWILFGYLSAHAAYAAACHALLATDNGQCVKVAVGVPTEWLDLRCREVHTPSGFKVTLRVKAGDVRELTLVNCHAGTRVVDVELLPRGHRGHQVWRGVSVTGRLRLR